MPVVSQSIMKPMVPVGREDDGLRVAPAVLRADRVAVGPRLRRELEHVGVQRRDAADRVGRRGVLAHHPGVRLGVAGEALVRPDHAGQLGRLRLYAVPVIREVIAAARARPPSESYGRPVAISSAPRLA